MEGMVLRALSEHHMSQQLAVLSPSSLTFSRPRKKVTPKGKKFSHNIIPISLLSYTPGVVTVMVVVMTIIFSRTTSDGFFTCFRFCFAQVVMVVVVVVKCFFQLDFF